MLSTLAQRGGELAKHRVERGIATHERRRKCSAFSVCCPSFLRERLICSLPSDVACRRFADNRPFRERKQTAVFCRRRFVSSSMGLRVAHSCLFSFGWSFLPVAGAVSYPAFRFARIIENGRSFFVRPFRRQIRLKS